jgi:hypothetical protein
MVGTRELASILMLSQRRVQQLTKDGVLSRDGTGAYDVFEAVPEYLRHIEDTPDKEDINEAKRRQAVADADLAEIELRIKRGIYRDINEICAAVTDEYGAVRAQLRSSATKIAAAETGLSLEERRELWLSYVDEALTELTTDAELQSDADSAVPDSGPEAPAEVDG